MKSDGDSGPRLAAITEPSQGAAALYDVESAGASARLNSALVKASPCHPRVTKLPSRITFRLPQ